MNESDDILVQKCLQNDQEAGRELFIRYALYLYRFAFRFTRNPSTAEEISQETWLRIFQHLHTYKSGSSFQSWAGKICYNLCVDHSRKLKLQQTIDHTAVIERCFASILLPIQMAEQSEWIARIKMWLHSIPDEFHLAFSLRYFEDLSYREIAQVTGCPETTARSRVFRATQLLREKFSYTG